MVKLKEIRRCDFCGRFMNKYKLVGNNKGWKEKCYKCDKKNKKNK